MSTWTLIQIVFDIFMATGIFTIVMRMNRAPKDDPRLSRGLQLLQSKISVLEDLSDRTEVQVNQLTAILEQKSREVQAKVQLAEQHVHELRVSMERSLEVAQIFQDKIPHKEIIERQKTIKYVQAARLAHHGADVDTIANQVDLPKGEIEFIASVNRERLMFNEADLPPWATGDAPAIAGPNSAQGAAAFAPAMAQHSFEEATETQEETERRLRVEMELAERQRLVEKLSGLQFEMKNLDMELAREHGTRDLSGAFEVPKVETASLKKLGEEFRRAVEEGEKSDSREQLFPLEQLTATISQVMTAAESMANQSLSQTLATATSSSAYQANPSMEPVLPASFAGRATASTLKQAISHASAAIREGVRPQAEAPRDPVLARALAQQKVQAALRAGAQPRQQSPSANPELEAARAMAKEATAPQPTTHIVRERTLSGRQPSSDTTIIKKVRFPSLDEPDV